MFRINRVKGTKFKFIDLHRRWRSMCFVPLFILGVLLKYLFENQHVVIAGFLILFIGGLYLAIFSKGRYRTIRKKWGHSNIVRFKNKWFDSGWRIKTKLHRLEVEDRTVRDLFRNDLSEWHGRFQGLRVVRTSEYYYVFFQKKE